MQRQCDFGFMRKYIQEKCTVLKYDTLTNNIHVSHSLKDSLALTILFLPLFFLFANTHTCMFHLHTQIHTSNVFRIMD